MAIPPPEYEPGTPLELAFKRPEAHAASFLRAGDLIACIFNMLNDADLGHCRQVSHCWRRIAHQFFPKRSFKFNPWQHLPSTKSNAIFFSVDSRGFPVPKHLCHHPYSTIGTWMNEPTQIREYTENEGHLLWALKTHALPLSSQIQGSRDLLCRAINTLGTITLMVYSRYLEEQKIHSGALLTPRHMAAKVDSEEKTIQMTSVLNRRFGLTLNYFISEPKPIYVRRKELGDCTLDLTDEHLSHFLSKLLLAWLTCRNSGLFFRAPMADEIIMSKELDMAWLPVCEEFNEVPDADWDVYNGRYVGWHNASPEKLIRYHNRMSVGEFYDAEMWVFGLLLAKILLGKHLFGPANEKEDHLNALDRMVATLDIRKIPDYLKENGMSEPLHSLANSITKHTPPEGQTVDTNHSLKDAIERANTLDPSENLASLLTGLLEFDFSKRITLDQALQHPFLSGRMEGLDLTRSYPKMRPIHEGLYPSLKSSNQVLSSIMERAARMAAIQSDPIVQSQFLSMENCVIC
jgi:hypothetical protein